MDFPGSGMKLMMELLPIIKHALVITFFVFTMMVLVDFIDTAGKRWLSRMMKGGQWRQYTLASFLGSTPGCLGAFMNVSLYVHGMISFGDSVSLPVPSPARTALPRSS